MHQYISAYENCPVKDTISSTADYVLVKNKHSQAVCVSSNFHHWGGFSKVIDCFGKTDAEFQCPISQLAPIFKQQDQLLLEKNTHKDYIVFGVYKNRPLQAYLTKKSAHKGLVVCQSWLLKEGTLYQYLSNIVRQMDKATHAHINHCFELIDTYSGLSMRESEVLYFLMQHYNSSHIARLVCLSKRTVQHYIENIKIKMQCDNTPHLLQLAYYLNYQCLIPKSLVKMSNLGS